MNSTTSANEPTADDLPPVFKAIKNYSTTDLDQLLQEGADPNTTLPDGTTPLHYAVSKGLSNTAALLLRHGAHVNARNAKGETPLYLAAVNDDSFCAIDLLEGGADTEIRSQETSETPLMVCTRRDSCRAGWALLRNNADPYATNAQGQAPLDIAIAHNSKRMQKKLELYLSTKRYTEFTHEQIRDATYYGSLSILEKLLQDGADPNAADEEGCTPLSYARWGYYDDIERIQMLIRYGADIYHRDKWGISFLLELTELLDIRSFDGNLTHYLLRYSDVNRRDAHGCNLLHYACYMGNAALVNDVLELGADPACRTGSGFLPLEISLARLEEDSLGQQEIIDRLRPLSPEPRQPLPRRMGYELVEAARDGKADTMRELLQAGADPNGDDWGIMSPDGFRDTPLLALAMARVENKSLTEQDMAEMTRMLLAAGADIDRSDNDYETPLHRAANFNNLGMARVLLQAGADPLARCTLDGTPLDIARGNRYTAMQQFLEEWINKKTSID